MTASTRAARRPLVVALIAAVVAIAPGGAQAAQYVPFVTDFPTSGPGAEPYVPFVSDFPRPASPAAPAAATSGIDWSNVSGIVFGIGGAALAAALLAGAGLFLVRRLDTNGETT
jgi:hypothetical protein